MGGEGRAPQPDAGRAPRGGAGEPPGSSGAPPDGSGAARGGLPRSSAGRLVGGRYRCGRALGRGTYGVVFEARDEAGEGGLVALKRVKLRRGGGAREGVPDTAVRELRVLETCRHENLVGLREVVDDGDGCLWLVLEHCTHDLARLVDWLGGASIPFRESEIKGLLLQILRGLAFMHDNWTMHRDLKPSNVLLTSSGVVKLCDFGLARRFHAVPREEAPSAQGRLSPKVVTLWYRAPEILLGGGPSEAYDEAVDMWACGCVFAELLRLRPLLRGSSESEQISLIVKLLGKPSERIWPGLRELSGFQESGLSQLPEQPYSHLASEFPNLGPEGLDLLNGLLTYCPEKRLTAREALAHEYFFVRPLPKSGPEMPSFPVLAEAQDGEPPRPLHAVGSDGGGGRGTKRPFHEGRGGQANPLPPGRQGWDGWS